MERAQDNWTQAAVQTKARVGHPRASKDFEAGSRFGAFQLRHRRQATWLRLGQATSKRCGSWRLTAVARDRHSAEDGPTLCSSRLPNRQQRRSRRGWNFEEPVVTIGCFLAAAGPGEHISTRQYARLVDSWVAMIGLEPRAYGTHSLRRTKVALVYKKTGNLRACQLLLGHRKLESTVRYLGIEVDDALALSEQVDL